MAVDRPVEERDSQIRRIAAMLVINKGMSRADAIAWLVRMSREERVAVRNKIRSSIGGKSGR